MVGAINGRAMGYFLYTQESGAIARNRKYDLRDVFAWLMWFSIPLENKINNVIKVSHKGSSVCDNLWRCKV